MPKKPDDITVIDDKTPELEPQAPIAGDFEPERIDLTAKTLAGDLRDTMLELFRDMREPWHGMGEERQRWLAERIGDRCMAVVTDAVKIIAAHDFPALPATIKDTKIKDGIEAKLVLSRHHPDRHILLDATGAEVTLVLIDARSFLGARGAPAIDKDEPELPIGSEGGEGMGAMLLDQPAVEPAAAE